MREYGGVGSQKKETESHTYTMVGCGRRPEAVICLFLPVNVNDLKCPCFAALLSNLIVKKRSNVHSLLFSASIRLLHFSLFFSVEINIKTGKSWGCLLNLTFLGLD